MPARSDETLASLAANIRKLRVSKGLTQEQLAEHTELHVTYIQGIERGTRNISVGVLLTVADVLKVPPYRLLKPAKLEPPKRGRPRKKKPTVVTTRPERIGPRDSGLGRRWRKQPTDFDLDRVERLDASDRRVIETPHSSH